MHPRLFFGIGCLGFALGLPAQTEPLNYLSQNHGLRLELQPPVVEDPENAPETLTTHYTVSWWWHSGRTYYLEGTDDLVANDWKCLMTEWPPHFFGEFPTSVSGSYDSS